MQAAGLAHQQLKLLYLLTPVLCAVLLPGLRHDRSSSRHAAEMHGATSTGAPLVTMLVLQLCLLAAHAAWLCAGITKV